MKARESPTLASVSVHRAPEPSPRAPPFLARARCSAATTAAADAPVRRLARVRGRGASCGPGVLAAARRQPPRARRLHSGAPHLPSTQQPRREPAAARLAHRSHFQELMRPSSPAPSEGCSAAKRRALHKAVQLRPRLLRGGATPHARRRRKREIPAPQTHAGHQRKFVPTLRTNGHAVPGSVQFGACTWKSHLVFIAWARQRR